MKFRLTLLFASAAFMVGSFSGCNTMDEVEEVPVAPAGNYPTARTIPDQPEVVLSPFTEERHYVEVAGLRSGTLVKCPWTQKLFYVP